MISSWIALLHNLEQAAQALAYQSFGNARPGFQTAVCQSIALRTCRTEKYHTHVAEHTWLWIPMDWKCAIIE